MTPQLQPKKSTRVRQRGASSTPTCSELPPAKLTPHPPKSRSKLTLEEHALGGLTACVRGYTYTEKKLIYELDSQGEKQLKSETLITKTVGADLRAIEFVLTNLCPEQWRVKPTESTSTAPAEEGIELSRLSDRALQEIIQLKNSSANE